MLHLGDETTKNSKYLPVLDGALFPPVPFPNATDAHGCVSRVPEHGGARLRQELSHQEVSHSADEQGLVEGALKA